MSTSAVTSTSSADLFANSVANSTPSQKGTQTLNENDFLKLLTQQLQNQDPLQPQDNTEMIAQMAQFSTLQQQNTMTEQMSALSANSYIGQTVTVNPGNGAAYVTGTVQGVDTSTASNPQIFINGTEYPLSEIQLIQPASAAAAATSTATTPSTTSS